MSLHPTDGFYTSSRMPTTVSSHLPWHDMWTAVQVHDNLISHLWCTHYWWLLYSTTTMLLKGSAISMAEPIQLLRHYHHHHYRITTKGCEVSCSSPDPIRQFLITAKWITKKMELVSKPSRSHRTWLDPSLGSCSWRNMWFQFHHFAHEMLIMKLHLAFHRLSCFYFRWIFRFI